MYWKTTGTPKNMTRHHSRWPFKSNNCWRNRTSCWPNWKDGEKKRRVDWFKFKSFTIKSQFRRRPSDGLTRGRCQMHAVLPNVALQEVFIDRPTWCLLSYCSTGGRAEAVGSHPADSVTTRHDPLDVWQWRVVADLRIDRDGRFGCLRHLQRLSFRRLQRVVSQRRHSRRVTFSHSESSTWPSAETKNRPPKFQSAAEEQSLHYR